MKKTLTKKLCMVIISVMLLTLALNYFLQREIARDAMCRSSVLKLEQIEKILDDNQKEMEELKQSLEKEYITLAKAAAYMIENDQYFTNSTKELRNIAKLLQIDELHLFTPEGELYAGTQPKYFGYTFHSGKQMEFFLPMLSDTSLELCQDMTPNTAENKLMQYTAVWREDKKGIIQIGIRPNRLLKEMEKNELSYIFSKIPEEQQTSIFAIDQQTGEIVGSTKSALIGQKASEIGLPFTELSKEKEEFIKMDTEDGYFVFSNIDSYLIGICQEKEKMYEDIPQSMFLVAFYLFMISGFMIVSILFLLDYYIIRDLKNIMGTMDRITRGDLDTVVRLTGAPEFVELGEQINKMVKSLLDTTNKLSQIFDAVDMSVGVYEYKKDMKRVLGTKKLKDILAITEEDMEVLLSDRILFEKKLEMIRNYPLEGEQNIFRLPGNQDRYVKILSFMSETNQFGVIVDVSSDVFERQKIIYERDYDLLTEIYTRRAFYSKMNEIFKKKDQIGYATMIMVDMDNLKFINDNFGHLNGDSAIQAIAKVLSACSAPNKIVGRLSGDEFAVFIYQCNSIEEIEVYIEQYRKEMKDITAVFTDGSSFQITFSAGYVFYPEFDLSYRELLRLSDEALYEAKRKGKATFYKYEE